ncbi:MAG: hypothetical protein ACRDX9_08030, partial [Acidimicrobiia bacterium]
NQQLYEKEALKATRRDWYPLLTIVGISNPLPEDAELVPALDGLSDTWGKYVIDLRGVEKQASFSTLLELAHILEADPRAAVAHTKGDPPLSMIRRWSLHDPDAEPRSERSLDDPSTGPAVPTAGSMPRPGWVVPKIVGTSDIPIQRQRPEESTALPDPGRW